MILFHYVSMTILSDEHIIHRRHIGSARAKLFRGKSHPSVNDILFHRVQQPIPSPEYLRSRWMELYGQSDKKNGLSY